jgi:hypothetical protein
MDRLLQCEECRHGATAHDSLGCETLGCRCTASREDVVAAGILAAKEEIRAMWERPSFPSAP